MQMKELLSEERRLNSARAAADGIYKFLTEYQNERQKGLYRNYGLSDE